jgi:hypothetical protein
MAVAAFAVGSIEMALGRYDDAESHMRQACDLAAEIGGAWTGTGARLALVILDIRQGRLAEARRGRRSPSSRPATDFLRFQALWAAALVDSLMSRWRPRNSVRAVRYWPGAIREA